MCAHVSQRKSPFDLSRGLGQVNRALKGMHRCLTHPLMADDQQYEPVQGAFVAGCNLCTEIWLRSGVALDSLLEGHSLWDLALITPGLARSYRFYFLL